MLFCSDLSEKKRAFLTGTLLLTAAGFKSEAKRS